MTSETGRLHRLIPGVYLVTCQLGNRFQETAIKNLLKHVSALVGWNELAFGKN
ncbi:MAG: hypothetical protein ACPIA2_04265 [Mariniblastus sp.]